MMRIIKVVIIKKNELLLNFILLNLMGKTFDYLSQLIKIVEEGLKFLVILLNALIHFAHLLEIHLNIQLVRIMVSRV